MSFVGVTVTNMTARNNMMNQICYDKVRHSCGLHGSCGVTLSLCTCQVHAHLSMRQLSYVNTQF
jgi:hypothetical protein